MDESIALRDEFLVNPVASLGFSTFHSNLSFFKDTDYLVYLSSTNLVILDTKSGAQIQSIFLGADKTNAIIISPENSHIFAGMQDGSILLIDVVSGRKISENNERKAPVECLAISDFNQSFMASADNEGVVRIMNTNNLKEKYILGAKSKAPIFLKFSPVKNELIVGDASGLLGLFDYSTGTEKWTTNTKIEVIKSINFAVKGSNIAILEENADLKI